MLGKSEVGKFENLIVNEDVIGFDVPMQQIGVMQHLVALGDLQDEVPDAVFGHECLFFYKFSKRPLVAILHDDVEVRLADNVRFEAVYQVLVAGQLADHLHLGLYGLLVVLVQQRYHLGHQLFVGILLVVGFVDGAVRTRPQLLVLRDEVGGPLETLPSDLPLPLHTLLKVIGLNLLPSSTILLLFNSHSCRQCDKTETNLINLL